MIIPLPYDTVLCHLSVKYGKVATFPMSLVRVDTHYLRVRPLGRWTVVSFPAGSQDVGRSGTSFSGARTSAMAECPFCQEGPESSAKTRHKYQDRAMDADPLPHEHAHTHTRPSPGHLAFSCGV